MGDFNDFALIAERKGGERSEVCLNRICQFRERIDDCSLSDPGCVGGLFTWIRKVNGRVILQERLERVLWNNEAVVGQKVR